MLLRSLGWHGAINFYLVLAFRNPFFPTYIAVAVVLGWLLAARLRDRSMLWVWVIPAIGMGYALIAIPTFIPRIVLPQFQAGIGQSRFFHYFGWGCGSGNYCLDQSSLTRPLYTSTAYSVAAYLSMKVRRLPAAEPTRRWTLVIAGILFFASTAYNYIISLPEAKPSGALWNLLYLIFFVVPAAVALFLVLLGLFPSPSFLRGTDPQRT
jgi:hypothetical protein